MELFVGVAFSTRLYVSLRTFSRKCHSKIEVFSSEIDDASDQKLRNLAISSLNRVPYQPSMYCYFDHYGQLQTAVQFFLRNLSRIVLHVFRTPNLFVYFDREIVELPDGGVVAIDWAFVQGMDSNLSPNSPIVILHHGLVGDSQSEYIYHFVRKLIKAGYKVGVMVARGCGGLPLKSVYTFAGRKTGDIRAVVKMVKNQHPNSKLFWIGYSLGAAATLQYLEDFHGQSENDASHLDAVMCVSPPWNFRPRSSNFLDIWPMLMVFPLKMYLLKHLDVLKELPTSNLSLFQFLAIPNMFELNKNCFNGFGGLTREGKSFLVENKMAKEDSTSVKQSNDSPSGQSKFSNPVQMDLISKHGTLQYTSVDDYYDDCSPAFLAHLITTPTLSVSAKDDPICSHKDCPKNRKEIGPGLVVVKTPLGGHLAFPEGNLPLAHAWTDRLAIEWFSHF